MATYNKAYSRLNWENEPSVRTPIDEINLNRMDSSINTLDDRVIELNTIKAEQSALLQTVKDVAFNEFTGVFTFTFWNGTTKTVDTLLEKIIINFTYDSANQSLKFTLKDGTVQAVPISEFITQNEFVDSTRIKFTVTNGKVTADIVKGTITADYLEPNYLANVTQQAENASSSASLAQQQAQTASDEATRAKSYARGGTNSRSGEETDNAKYYAEQAQQAAEQASGSISGVSTWNIRSGNVMPAKGDYTGSLVTVQDNKNLSGDEQELYTDKTVDLQSMIDAIVNSFAQIFSVIEVIGMQGDVVTSKAYAADDIMLVGFDSLSGTRDGLALYKVVQPISRGVNVYLDNTSYFVPITIRDITSTQQQVGVILEVNPSPEPTESGAMWIVTN